MRLIFSTDHYLNTSMVDEHGPTLYTVSTSGFFNPQTTIRKADPSGGPNDLTTVAIFQWGGFGGDKICFGGRTIRAAQLMRRQWFSSSRVFVGPDNQTYKWKIRSYGNCWLKRANMDGQLAKFHQRNLGIRKPSHPPYLEISESLHHMLDYVVITSIYAEKLRRSNSKYG